MNATIKQLQEENKSLQMDTFNSAIELSKVESQLQMEKHQQDMLKNKRQTYMNSLLSENEILREKLVRKTEECEHLSNEQKQLNEKLSVQFDDIITLKSQIKNFVNANDRDETVFREVYKHSSPPKKDKPTALLIGTSNINYIKPDKLTQAVSVSKINAFTLDDTVHKVESSSGNPDVVILHSLTNDIKNFTPEQCVDKMDVVVNKISTKWENSKIIVSLTTPRSDKDIHAVNSKIVDGLVKKKFLNRNNIFIYNMKHGNIPTNQLLRDDKFHLSPKGTSILATNLKNALHYVLNIKPPGNTSYPKHRDADKNFHTPYNNKGNNKIIELRTILQRESQNS